MTRGREIVDEFMRLPSRDRWRARNIAKGMCPSCGKDKQGSVKRFCPECQKKHAVRQLAAYHARKARKVKA